MCRERAKPANWENWGDIERLEVWEAIALSFGAEPVSIPGLYLDWRENQFENCPNDFRERLMIACTHAVRGTLHPVDWSDQVPFYKVRATDFATWASASPREWKLPAEFPGRQGTESGRPPLHALNATEAEHALLPLEPGRDDKSVVKLATVNQGDLDRFIGNLAKEKGKVPTIEAAWDAAKAKFPDKSVPRDSRLIPALRTARNGEAGRVGRPPKNPPK